MNTIPKIRQSGFSLIELLVAVAVLAILVALAAPGMRVWLQNAQIRNAAESIQSGLQRARAEAVLRNRNVEFVLSGTDGGCEAAANCSSWSVLEATGKFSIDSRSSNEGSADINRSVDPAGLTTVTFNNVGNRTTSNADGSAPFISVTLDSTNLPAADSRELTIRIGIGGNVKMCDPSIYTGPRAC